MSGKIIPLTSLFVMVPSISLIIILSDCSQTNMLQQHLVVPNYMNICNDMLTSTFYFNLNPVFSFSDLNFQLNPLNEGVSKFIVVVRIRMIRYFFHWIRILLITTDIYYIFLYFMPTYILLYSYLPFKQ